MSDPAGTRRLVLAAGASAALAVAASRLLFPPVQFHPVLPCRLVDTRQVGPQSTARPLAGGETQTFRVQGECEVPIGATAVVLNATVLFPSSGGDLRLFPADHPVPKVSTLSFAADSMVSNGAILPLSPVSRDTDKDLALVLAMPPGGGAHVLLDVTGYFK